MTYLFGSSLRSSRKYGHPHGQRVDSGGLPVSSIHCRHTFPWMHVTPISRPLERERDAAPLDAADDAEERDHEEGRDGPRDGRVALGQPLECPNHDVSSQ